jgi:hypothetical protein
MISSWMRCSRTGSRFDFAMALYELKELTQSEPHEQEKVSTTDPDAVYFKGADLRRLATSTII